MFDEFELIKREVYQSSAFNHGEPKARQLVHSDIVAHLPVLQWYASLCDHVTEFGVRDGHSTLALIAGCRGDVRSFDIERTPVVGRLNALILPCSSWQFTQLDTGYEPMAHKVSETDLLFIDTAHTYTQVEKELRLHGRKARRFLAFHDISTCGIKDRSGPDPEAPGIGPAILEFIAKYPSQYVERYRTNWNNGFLLIERVSN